MKCATILNSYLIPVLTNIVMTYKGQSFMSTQNKLVTFLESDLKNIKDLNKTDTQCFVTQDFMSDTLDIKNPIVINGTKYVPSDIVFDGREYTTHIDHNLVYLYIPKNNSMSNALYLFELILNKYYTSETTSIIYRNFNKCKYLSREQLQYVLNLIAGCSNYDNIYILYSFNANELDILHNINDKLKAETMLLCITKNGNTMSIGFDFVCNNAKVILL